VKITKLLTVSIMPLFCYFFPFGNRHRQSVIMVMIMMTMTIKMAMLVMVAVAVIVVAVVSGGGDVGGDGQEQIKTRKGKRF